MSGTALTQQSPVPLRRANQIQATGDEEADEGVVPEDVVTKDVAEEARTRSDHPPNGNADVC